MSCHNKSNLLAAITSIFVAAVLAGCGAPPPVDFGGNWVPVNRFQDKPQEIPLNPTYAYYASPLDGTLRSMLRRWADDNGMPLVWQLNSDYTLYKAVAQLQVTDLQEAVRQLNAIYADEGVLITADPERILVSVLVKPASDASPPSSAPTSSKERKRPAKSSAANSATARAPATKPASGNVPTASPTTVVGASTVGGAPTTAKSAAASASAASPAVASASAASAAASVSIASASAARPAASLATSAAR